MKNFINLCAFEKIDVLNCVVPPFPFPQLPSIVERAKSILSRRSQQEIVDASAMLALMINSYFQDQEDCNKHRQEIVAMFGSAPITIKNGALKAPQNISPIDDMHKFLMDYPNPLNTTELAALQACIDDFELSNATFEDASKQEYFAALALWLVVDCIDWSRINGELEEKPTPNNVDISTTTANGIIFSDRLEMAYAGILANEAMSAIHHAEKLASTKEIAKKTKEILSQKATDAANARNMPVNQVKDYAIQLLYSRPWHSMMYARDSLYPQVVQYAKDNKINFPLSPGNGPRTVYVWFQKANKIRPMQKSAKSKK